MTVRTRFAPSPTGYLHVGGARTALFCWLFARHTGGEFVLRIEDTDRERSTPESVQVILDAMAWLQLDYDEGPIYQTQRFDRYAEVTEQLLAQDKAYFCYCSRERLAELREQQTQAGVKPRYDGFCSHGQEAVDGVEPVVRFRSPADGEVIVNDLVHGVTVFANSELDDLIIRRSDGTPTYNFTVVVDDMDMQISHVIRGDDHLNNTPRQVNIYQALGADVPQFAHLPMILGADGSRLSKRHGAVNVLEYRESGFLPAALLNYLVRLGWSHGDQEIFSISEMVALFDLVDVNKAASKFNPEKLLWLNQQYIKETAADKLAPILEPHLQRCGMAELDPAQLRAIVEVQRDRVKTMAEMAQASEFLFQSIDSYDQKAAAKHLKPAAKPVLAEVLRRVRDIEPWSIEALHSVVEQTAAALELKMGKVAQPLRVAVTGGPVSPSIDATLFLLGQAQTVQRLQQALAWIDSQNG